MDLYNKYRQRTFEEMYPSSEFIKTAATRVAATLQGKDGLAQALLFYSTEPGVGKTTCARILAVTLNPNLREDEKDRVFAGMNTQIFREYNCASFRKIDDIRILEETIEGLRNPLDDFRTVFVLNEAHQLTADAQQAMLHLVETLPDSVYIIMTTTDMHKILDKLRSRFEHHHFRPLSENDMFSLLTKLSQEHNVSPERELLNHIVEASHGCIRDALVYFSQYLNSGTVEIVDEKEEYDVHMYRDVVRCFTDLGKGTAVGWWKNISPLLVKLTNQEDPETVRIKILIAVYGLLVGEAKLNKSEAKALAQLSEVLDQPVHNPAAKSALASRMFRLFVKLRFEEDPPVQEH